MKGRVLMQRQIGPAPGSFRGPGTLASHDSFRLVGTLRLINSFNYSDTLLGSDSLLKFVTIRFNGSFNSEGTF